MNKECVTVEYVDKGVAVDRATGTKYVCIDTDKNWFECQTTGVLFEISKRDCNDNVTELREV